MSSSNKGVEEREQWRARITRALEELQDDQYGLYVLTVDQLTASGGGGDSDGVPPPAPAAAP